VEGRGHRQGAVGEGRKVRARANVRERTCASERKCASESARAKRAYLISELNRYSLAQLLARVHLRLKTTWAARPKQTCRSKHAERAFAFHADLCVALSFPPINPRFPRRYCIKCQVTAAKKCCKVCKDAYCERCFRDVHAVGNISKHPWVTWAEYKAGWQEVKGRVEGERNYYFNATTLESVNEKPEELMLEEELAEHKKHMQYFKENEKNKDRVKKLQEKVQQYEYEKDQLWFEMNMKKSAEAEELELLRSALEAAEAKKKDQWKKMLLHPIKFYKEWVIEQKKAQQAYRRKLLLSAKQRKTLGLNTAPAEET